ncbi:MAG TPA: hypothetical protein VN376_00235 [Longilinea sp.]|nr:hypothetical protein [Longilinea sp.]
MAKLDPDGIIEAVRYTPEGMVDLVRYYPRRGPTYADVHLLTRPQLVEQLKNGKVFQVGQRQANMGSSFTCQTKVSLSTSSTEPLLTTKSVSAACDDLSPAPIF